MSSVKLSRNKLAAVLLDYVKAKGLSKTQATKIAAYLIEQKRTKEIDSLMRDMMKRQAEDGRLEVTAISAHGLNSQIHGQIKNLLPAKKHVINEVIEPEVLGGILIETADSQLDLTVARKIQKLRSIS